MAISPSRVKSVVGTGVTTLTATFDQSTPLPAGSLLLACAFWTGATDSPTHDWTSAVVTQGGSNGSSNITVFVAKQSDGATNGITVSWPAAQSYARIVLVAVPGFVSATPDKTAPANAASGTSATVGPTAATTGSAFVVSTVGMNAGSSGGWTGDWGGTQGIIFRNSIMAGGMASALGFAEVTNVRSSGPFSGTVASGGFTVDSSLNAPPMDTAQVNEWSPYPDDAYLAAIWD